MSVNGNLICELTSAEADRVESCATELMAEVGTDLWRAELVRLIAPLSTGMPSRLAAAVRSFRSAPPAGGALIVRGLECLREERPTPTEPGSYEPVMTVGSAAMLLVASSLGEPFSFAAEKSGALVHNVVPVPGLESEQSNAGSTTAFQMHVENAFHDCRPDHIVLACARSDPAGDAGLLVSPIANAIKTMSREVVEALFRDAYATARPTSFGGGEPTIHQIMSGDPNDPNIRVDFAATRPLEAGGAADENLRLLEEAVSSAAETVKLAAGDIAIVDNRVALHGRTAFKPQFDGRDRWLHRVYSSLDNRKSRGLRRNNSFVIE